MNYKSFEYMRKTLPNEFNWSILYQLFKEDEIELSEAAEGYLRTTPWNTNLTILEEILKAEADGPIVFTMDNLEVDSTYMVTGGTSLPVGIEKLSAEDNVNVKIEFSKGITLSCTSVVQSNGEGQLSINIADGLVGYCNSGILFITLQPDKWNWTGITLDGSTHDEELIDRTGTSVTFTITKI